MTFTNPTVLNVTTQTVTVSVPEQDYFYWPCMSGEKYAPTLVQGSGSAGTSIYTSKDLYPAILIQRPSTTAPNGSALWPVMPPWKYSASGFAGYTLSLRLNLGNSGSSGPQGGTLQLSGSASTINGNSNDLMVFNVGQSMSYNFGNSSAGLGLTVAGNTWYTLTLDFDSSARVTVTVNGTVYLTSKTTNMALNPLQLYAVTTFSGGFSGSQVYLSQFQVTYK